MVHENGCILVPGPGKSPLHLRKESWFCGLQLVHGDALAGPRGGENRTLGLRVFASPWDSCHRPKQTARALWKADGCKLLGDLAMQSKLAEFCEGGVPESIMPAHQFGFVVRCQKGVFFGLFKRGGRRRRTEEGGE
jgi:hypothetical protein